MKCFLRNQRKKERFFVSVLLFVFLFPVFSLFLAFLSPTFPDFYTATQSNPSNHTLPVFSVATEKKAVSVTFNAAWEGEDIPQLLEILKKYDVTATFFVVGDYVKENPDQIKTISAAGHEIANHSDRHPHVQNLSEEAIIEDIAACEEKLKSLGIKSAPYYRPPYGEFDAHIVKAAQNAGLLCVQWSVDSRDWQNPSAEEMTQKILKTTKAGDILLFHTGKENTLAALPTILSSLQKDGFSIQPLSKLLLSPPFSIDHTGKMYQTP